MELLAGGGLVDGAGVLLTLSVVVFVVLVMPVLLLAHELGHAAVALSLTNERVYVVLGPGESWKVTVGRLVVVGSLFAGRAGLCDYESDRDVLSRTQLIGFYLAGPVATLLVFSCALWADASIGDPRLRYLLPTIVWHQGLMILLTLAPVTYPSWLPGTRTQIRSDGYLAWETFSGEP